ncbi:6207_t:CDS:2, partial [Ambispora leptoticha]
MKYTVTRTLVAKFNLDRKLEFHIQIQYYKAMTNSACLDYQVGRIKAMLYIPFQYSRDSQLTLRHNKFVFFCGHGGPDVTLIEDRCLPNILRSQASGVPEDIQVP